MSFRFKEKEIGVFKDKYCDKVFDKFSKDFSFFGLTNGDFSLIDLIHSALKKTGKADLVVCTWSAGIKDANQVKWMVESDLINTFLLITDHSYATRQSKYSASIEELFGKENIRTTEIHAKFVLIKNENYSLVITSSMNLNANKTCEIFEIDSNLSKINFLENFVNHIKNNQIDGFVKESRTINQTLKSFFNKKDHNSERNWYDLKSE